ncbi:MAG: hypothetical protein EBT57_08780, partial [Verrucomicrobia bacterium]|nr:hypothetical protein [Verrucomicrobiota bacterium]
EEACRETGTRLAQEASYLNFSRTYLTPAGHWVRIDYESEVRWRVFPVLQARAVLLRRIRLDGLWVASPADEAVVLWIASLFRQFLSDRYRNRLLELDKKMRSFFPPALGTYREAFGRWGARLLQQQSDWLKNENLRPLWDDFKLALILRVILRPTLGQKFVFYLLYDLERAIRRAYHPRGVFLSVESSAWDQADSLELLWRLDRIFPVAKSVFLRSGDRAFSWREKLRISRALFKGGLVLCPPQGRPVSLPRHTRGIRMRHDPENGWIGATMPGGWMIPNLQAKDRVESCYQMSLQALTMPFPFSRLPKAYFCVILGLDGSGKTTLARQLSQRICQTSACPAVRYFHFLPSSAEKTEFPWPQQAAEPKKRESPDTTGGSFFSLLRLVRNWGRSWWNIGFRHRGFRGLLLGDRYLYNYLLDPVSVRYFGPVSWVTRALRWAPRPNLIFVLETPPEVILQRKQELSAEEIRIQSEQLGKLPLVARRVVRLDGARRPEDLADQCLREIGLDLGKS